MEKQKRWQLFLILAVIALTIYNILPTIFFYSKPLKTPVDAQKAEEVAKDIIERVNGLEDFTLNWLKAQSKNLGLKPLKISLDPENPKIAKVTFKKPENALFFANTLPRAGAMIPFVPSQLSLDPRSLEEEPSTVLVQRKIGVHLQPEATNEYFHFIPKNTTSGEISSAYRALVKDRLLELALGFGGTSRPAKILSELAQDSSKNDRNDDSILRLARTIVEFENAFGDTSPIAKRYFASFSQISKDEIKNDNLIALFISRLEKISQQLNSKIQEIKEEQANLKSQGNFLSSEQQQKLEVYDNQKNAIDSAITIIRRNISTFQHGENPLSQEDIYQALNKDSTGKVQVLLIGNRNPFINELKINWVDDTIEIVLHSDVNAIRNSEIKSEVSAIQVEKLNQLLFNEIAIVARLTDETITPSLFSFVVQLDKLTNTTGLLTLDLGALAKLQIQTLLNMLKTSWKTSSQEFSSTSFPILDYPAFKNLSPSQRKLGLVLYAPTLDGQMQEGFRKGSIYVIARGLGAMIQKNRDQAESDEKNTFDKDFRSLQELMRQNGFIGYFSLDSNLSAAFRDDYIFELDDYYSYVIAATREDFSIKGGKHFAVLEFTDYEQRLLTLNKIETRIHEDLAKWKDEYEAVRTNIDSHARYDVPKPTQSLLLSNLELSAKKYFRGDERKILRWGLDLSGGKTVRIGLKDHNNQAITEEQDLRQAVNELYQRVNRLGVSEVGIRIEGSNIVLDFPGSQNLSASDLIQASAMHFHVVNEKFTPSNPTLREAVNNFLEEVWNEAVITNRTDPESINEIAWQHLGGSSENPEEFQPLTSHAKLLYDHGLRLAGPKGAPITSVFNDSLSAITLFRGSDFSDWQGQTNPLLVIFRNYALEGANVADVQTGYDPSEGNVLMFSVKSSAIGRDGQKFNPREDFYTWTSQFSEEKITGTPKESLSHGRGWRMAVILNGSVISAPSLTSALRDSARISGHFSQREVNQLAADLKAGSLSFTPQILSEENVSPDLGQAQRNQGIFAAVLGLFLVIITMCLYYRFGGLVASAAVFFNLLILWGVLQNLGAAITLPGIAGIILAVGMSVDANVLVFERIREEFAHSKRLPSAIQAGYRKAFSAIVDSNLTTIIAGLILLNFDSGPIKGFALTLIIGILSSMFTSLFMTRYFFAGWVQNPKHKTLKMAQLFGITKIDFLSKAKPALILSLIVIVLGLGGLWVERHTILGMDFTGGYALTLEIKEKQESDYRSEATQALVNAGAPRSEFQIQELNRPNYLRIQLGMGMEQPGRPFYQIEAKEDQKILYPYQENPRIVWIVDALLQSGLEVDPLSLAQLDLHWTEMSGQLSDTMRNEALIGLALALFCILIYITFRFEFKYAISATIGLVHDILITLGLLAFLHYFMESVKIDLQVVAALMTIIGYSLNDTIIIFDRIREDIRLMRKMSFSEIINHALNATLSRTVMTSSTTVLVLLALVFFGGSSIFNFALIMALGIIVGTFSSLFVASPILLYFHNREAAKQNTEYTAPRKIA